MDLHAHTKSNFIIVFFKSWPLRSIQQNMELENRRYPHNYLITFFKSSPSNQVFVQLFWWVLWDSHYLFCRKYAHLLGQGLGFFFFFSFLLHDKYCNSLFLRFVVKKETQNCYLENKKSTTQSTVTIGFFIKRVMLKQ